MDGRTAQRIGGQGKVICPLCEQDVDDRLFIENICLRCVEDYSGQDEVICSDYEASLADESTEDQEE